VPIQRAGKVYTFTGNIINYALVIQKDDIVVDGSGYSLQDKDVYIRYAVYITGGSNVTLKGLKIENFPFIGIIIENSANVTIEENTLVDTPVG
jgi:parallel beta-helix repeat protein